MKLGSQPTTGIITVEISTPNGSRIISTGTKDPELANEIVEAANLRKIEVLSRAGELTQALIQKLVIGGNITVGKAYLDWVAWIRDTANSQRTEESMVQYVTAWMRDTKQEKCRLCTIRDRDLSNWVNQDRENLKAASRKVMLAALRSFFKYCSIKNWLNPDPARFVRVKYKLLSHAQKEAKKKIIFTDKELHKVEDYLTLQIADLSTMKAGKQNTKRLMKLRFWYCALMIGRYAGLRLSDICCLEKESLKVPGKLIVWTDKEDTRVEIPVTPELAKGIDSIQKVSGRFCFPHYDRKARTPNRSVISLEFIRICRECGFHNHSFHDLRHTLATELKVRGASLSEIAKALGHRCEKSTLGYLHD